MLRTLFSGNTEISIFGIAALLLFFLIFAGVVLWAFFGSSDYMKTMGRLPLDKNGNSANKH